MVCTSSFMGESQIQILHFIIPPYAVFLFAHVSDDNGGDLMCTGRVPDNLAIIKIISSVLIVSIAYQHNQGIVELKTKIIFP